MPWAIPALILGGVGLLIVPLAIIGIAVLLVVRGVQGKRSGAWSTEFVLDRQLVVFVFLGRRQQRQLELLVQRDVDALLGWRRRVDPPLGGIDRPPALTVAVDHPALDVVDAGVLHGLLGRAEDNRVRPARAR